MSKSDGPQPRERPYVWVTWMPRLLSGNHHCEWASWFKTRHDGKTWRHAPRTTYEPAQWALAHNALLRAERKRLEADGATVMVERRNQFRLRGEAATLSGMPDLVSLKDGQAVIHDLKSGEPHEYHVLQVMLYMWAFPLARREYAGLPLSGRVVYPDHEVDVPASAIDDAFVERAVDLIKTLADEEPPPRTPSASECSYCDITSDDCPDRIEDAAPSEEATDLF